MQQTEELGFIHKWVPAKSGYFHPVTLLLLHGTGGDENALLSVGNELWPGGAPRTAGQGLGVCHASILSTVHGGWCRSRPFQDGRAGTIYRWRFGTIWFQQKKADCRWLFERCNPRRQFDSASPALPCWCSSFSSDGTPGARSD